MSNMNIPTLIISDIKLQYFMSPYMLLYSGGVSSDIILLCYICHITI